jgi:hypothetical protein
LKTIAEVELSNLGKYKKSSLDYKVPSAERYFRVLKKGKYDKKSKERYLRIRAWWAANDIRRDPSLIIDNYSDTSEEKKAERHRRWKANARRPLSEDEVDNLEALIELLDESDSNDRLMKAEIMRNLGQFWETSKLLSGTFDEETLTAAGIIRDLVKKKERFVAEMKTEF